MRSSLFPIAFLAAGYLGFPLPARSQQAPLNSAILIQKIEPTFVESPKIISGYSKKAQPRAPKWLEIDVTFDRNVVPKAPKFIEELTFNYYILLKNEKDTEDRKPTLLTGSVTHVHTPQEKGLHAVAYVSPRTLARFFEGKVPVNAQQTVEDVGIEVGGLAIKTWKGQLGGTPQAPVGWWTALAQKYTSASGFVLSKDQTPFAPLEWDYFEPVKSKSGN
ncbi:MAG: Amuc_1102 family pilus-like protein [Verrucomicrobiae bacterium]